MTKKYFTLPLLVLILAACGGGGGNKKAEELQKLKQDKAAIDQKITALEKELNVKDSVKMKTVTVAPIAAATFEHYIDVQGHVDARENVNVSAQQPGIVKSILVKEGQRVSKGQTLAQLDNQVMQANIAELQTQIELAKTLYQKQENLWKQQIGSEVQYLNAKSSYEGLVRKMNTLNEQSALSRIVSPINGIVDAVIAKLGDQAAPGAPAFRVVNNTDLRVVASIAESYAGLVKSGDEAILNFPDINKEVRTKISFAASVIDPLSRTINVEIPVKGDKDVRPNMIALLRIVDYRAQNAVVVPVNVVQYSMGKPYVMVVKGQGDKLQAVRKMVELGRTYNDQAEIKSGLAAGDRLITSGFQGLNDNDFVKL